MKEYYLAHPFDARKWVRKWQIKIQKELPKLKLTNPFYCKYWEQTENWKSGDESGEELYKKLNDKSIVKRDIYLIGKQKDGIIYVIDGNISYGTIQEIVYAKMFHKEVIGLVTNGHEKHPWLTFHSDKIFTKLNDLEKYLCHTSNKKKD